MHGNWEDAGTCARAGRGCVAEAQQSPSAYTLGTTSLLLGCSWSAVPSLGRPFISTCMQGAFTPHARKACQVGIVISLLATTAHMPQALHHCCAESSDHGLPRAYSGNHFGVSRHIKALDDFTSISDLMDLGSPEHNTLWLGQTTIQKWGRCPAYVRVSWLAKYLGLCRALCSSMNHQARGTSMPR